MKVTKWDLKILTIITVFFMLTGTGTASTYALRGMSGALKNPAAERVLSRLLGISVARLSGMGIEQRGRLLARELDALEDRKLATGIKDAFRKISEKRPGAEREIEGLLVRIPNKKVSVRNFLKNTRGDGGLAIKSGALKMLRKRVERGEFASHMVDEFSQTVQSAGKALGFSILGSSADTCLKTFPPSQVEKFMTLVSSLRNRGALASVHSAFNAMVSKSEKLFGEGLVKAQERVCGLAGRGYRCNALAPQMCPL